MTWVGDTIMDLPETTWGFRHGLPVNGPVRFWGDESEFGYVRSNLPLFVSAELERIGRWSLTLEWHEEDGLSPRRPGHFKPWDVMEDLGLSREEWAAAKFEGLHSDFLRETGWSRYALTDGGRALLDQMETPLRRSY